ncbi:hypothetical protein [Maribacter sp. ACAM166]|uniref:hypothetical protein n=1 Tax=Maribacter sp. ACAM166 TaxID=2508996 RepID=UPI0010FDB9E0|nr:hypothetical protein [Maribacter sp. ACAM166]TLP79232.1 hypothetical protein ES765_10725 [Maribacter sp. ACAM166]
MNDKRKEICLNYLKARKEFLDFGNSDEVLHGNDNIVGRIGEAIAHSFLEHKYRQPKVLINQTNAGYDILCAKGDPRISVKMITSENKTGSTSQIKHDWDELIGIELGEHQKVIKLGVISRANFEGEQKKRGRRLDPNFSRTMLKPNGVFAAAGKVYENEELKVFNLL